MAEKLQIVIDVDGRKATTTLKNVDDGVVKIGKSSKKTSKSVSGLRNAIGGIALGASAKAAFDSIVSAGLATQRMMNTLEVATGDAGNSMQFLRDESNRLGLDLEKSAIAFSKFAAAAKGTALEGQGARDVFSSVATASVAMGLTAEQTEGAMRALEQMMSKGNVQAEELRGQLGERLPGAFSLAAKSMGVTTQELNKMLERGEVLAVDLLPKLAKTLNEEFGEGAQTASGNAQAQFNRLSTAIFTLSNAVAESGVLQALADMAGVVADSANAWATWINVWNESETDATALAFRINDLGEEIAEMAASGEDVAELNAELARLMGLRSALIAAAPSGDKGAGAGDGEADREQIKLDKLLLARNAYFANLQILTDAAEGSAEEIAIASEEVRHNKELAAQSLLHQQLWANDKLSAEQRAQLKKDSIKAAENLEAKHQGNLKKIDDVSTKGKLNAAKTGLGQLSALMNTENRKAFEIGKAAATANAVIKTYEAATGAYAALAGIPIVGPALGAVAAAAAIAAGMANIQAIQSTSFGSQGAGVASGGGIPNVGGGSVPTPQPAPEAPAQQQAGGFEVTLILQALDPNSITDETMQRMADSLAAPLEESFGRGVGTNRAVMV